MLAADVVRLEVGEDRLEVITAALDRLDPGRHAVAVELESRWRGEGVAVGVLELAQRDDVAVSVLEVLAEVDQQVGLIGAGGVRVELGPDQLPLAGVGVDDDDRRLGAKRLAHVGDRDRVGLRIRLRRVHARHAKDDRGAGAEPVAGVDLGRIDGCPAGVRRHRCGLQVEPQAGRGRVVGTRVEVVRVREQALPAGRRDRIAAIGGRHVDADRVLAVAPRRVALHLPLHSHVGLVALDGEPCGQPQLRLQAAPHQRRSGAVDLEARLRLVARADADLLVRGDVRLLARLQGCERKRHPLRFPAPVGNGCAGLAAVGECRLVRLLQLQLHLRRRLRRARRSGEDDDEHEGDRHDCC